jgi:asparagine synthetase A
MNVILLHSNHQYVSTTLKMVTYCFETCRWLLDNKITFIHSSELVDLYKNFSQTGLGPNLPAYQLVPQGTAASL